jgi:hypothetical protein
MDTMTSLTRFTESRWTKRLAEYERSRFWRGMIQACLKGALIGLSLYTAIDVLSSL